MSQATTTRRTRMELLAALQDLEANKALLTEREYREYRAELQGEWDELHRPARLAAEQAGELDLA